MGMFSGVWFDSNTRSWNKGSYYLCKFFFFLWAFMGVQCYLTTDEQKAQIMEMSVDDIVTLRGKIKSVGEVLGYSLDIDSIN